MRNVLFVISIFVLIIGCDKRHRKPIHHIDYAKVERVDIKANPKQISVVNNDTLRSIPFEKVEGIIEDINKSNNAGPIKFAYQYELRVYLKDKTVRKFEFVGDVFRENSNEITQEIRTPDYSNKLWKMAEKK